MSAPRTASDVMIRDLVTVRPGDHVFDAMRKLLVRGITGAPVIDDDGRFLGVFSEKCSLSVLSLTAKVAEDEEDRPVNPVVAEDFMTTDLVTLSEKMDPVEAMEKLLRHRISGAPVVDGDRFLGVFSERFSMNVLMAFVYDQIPATILEPFVNRDFGRVIGPDMPVMDVARRFLETSYRRLPVLEGERILGQISRRDVLRARHHLGPVLAKPISRLLATDESENTRTARSLLRGPFASGAVTSVMDAEARTIGPDTSLLEVAQIFMSTDFRRLPVLEGDRLVGQLSRRDVLASFHALLQHAPHREKALLYLGVLKDSEEAKALFT